MTVKKSTGLRRTVYLSRSLLRVVCKGLVLLLTDCVKRIINVGCVSV